jgi:ribonuclease VapC
VIVVDSSILVGIIKGEPDVEALLPLLAQEACAVGAPTLVETRAWCSVNMKVRSSSWLDSFLDSGDGTVLPFSRDMADVASQAFDRFGRASGHAARLNFGDCMAYGVATVMRLPLLYKGRDFAATDVLAHPASIRV